MTKDEFKQAIQHWRAAKGYTQQEAADRLGISVRTLQNWEIARNMPKGYGINALLKTIGHKPPRP